MKFKKFMALALALIMATALCVPALASSDSSASADSSSMTQTTNMTGSTQVGKINLVITAPTGLVFNPSKIYVKVATETGAVNDNADDDDSITVNDQIIVPTIQITNKTNVPLNLTATVAVKPSSESIEVVTADIKDSVVKKQIMVTADFAVYDGDIYAESNAATIRDDAWLTASKLTAAKGEKGTDGSIASGGKSHTAAQAVKIPAATKASEGYTPNYVYVKFGGAATKVPTTPWSQSDKFDIYTTYQFQPQTTPEKRILIATQPLSGTGTNASYADLAASGVSTKAPTFTVSYHHGNLPVSYPDALNATNNSLGATVNKFKIPDSDNYITGRDVWPGYTVTIKPVQDTTTGKYYAITAAPTFLNEDGTANTSVKATKVGSKSDAYYTFVMPDANVQCIVTFGTTVS